MPKDIEITPDSFELEREDSDLATRSLNSKLNRIAVKQHLLSSELRTGVSSKYPDYDLDRLESFADRLIQENTRKQAEPDIVSRHIRRASRLIEEATKPVAPKRFETVWHPGRRVDVFPRTIFGTDAWIARRYFPRTAREGYAPKFVSRLLALPCVQREVRRQVMFAKRKAGRGYKVSHRMSQFSDIWC